MHGPEQTKPSGKRVLKMTLVAALGAAACVVLMSPGVAAPVALRSGAHPTFHVTNRYHRTVSISGLGTQIADSQSSNWSGYNQGILESGTPTSSISAQWTVPTATEHTAGQAEDSATWIGVGGGCLDASCSATDNTLVQAGTEQDVSRLGTGEL